MNVPRVSRKLFLLPFFVLLVWILPAGGLWRQDSVMASQTKETEEEAWDPSGFLTAVEDEPDTVDFQCTTIYYTIAMNVFDRLVEMENDKNGNAVRSPKTGGPIPLSCARA